MKKWKRCLAMMLAASMSFTMLPVSAAMAAELEREAGKEGGEVQALADTDTQYGLLAFFDFNEDAQNGKFVSGETVASVVGTVALQDRDAVNGKAVYLDGSKSYLDLKKADDSSLLTGLQELTVSFDAKPDQSGTNWGFYAAPNANAPTVNQEHYIGTLIKGGTTTVERYNNSGSRPKNPSAATGTDWSHVDVVFTQSATTIYLVGIMLEGVYGRKITVRR